MILNIFFLIKLIRQFRGAKKIQGGKLPKNTIFQNSETLNVLPKVVFVVIPGMSLVVVAIDIVDVIYFLFFFLFIYFSEVVTKLTGRANEHKNYIFFLFLHLLLIKP
jgi:hypothetical protein